MPLRAGRAHRVINCEIGDDLSGQLHRRIAEVVRDDLEANILFLENGGRRILLVNLDLIAVPEETPEIREAVSERTGVPPRDVLLSATHTHVGADVLGLLHDAPRNTEYVGRLKQWIVDGAAEAVESARPARVGWAAGHAHVGFNRRLCWADGTHSMYGDSSRPDFVGLEGPDDPTHSALFVVDADGAHLGVVHNNCCHTTTIEGERCISADFPGEARRLLRETLGDDLSVLYLQGASGDTSPWNMLRTPYRWDGEQRCREIGRLLSGETLRILHEAEWSDDPVIAHAWEDMETPVRLPDDEQLARAREVKALGEEQAGRKDYVLLVAGMLRLHETWAENPVDTVPVHAVRVGGLGIAANPCEMYCRFGIDVRRRSPTAVTMISQLTDAFCGYCPTIHGLLGGGYSSEPTWWCRLAPETGYRWVDAAARLLRQTWDMTPGT